jgi:hypothetical protein
MMRYMTMLLQAQKGMYIASYGTGQGQPITTIMTAQESTLLFSLWLGIRAMGYGELGKEWG